jgi:hypothetical protein
MRYCDNCGAPLDERAIANRLCSVCGTPTYASASGDIPSAGDGGPREPSASVAHSPASSPYAASPLWRAAPPPPPHPPQRNGMTTVLGFIGGIVVALVLLALMVGIVVRLANAGAQNIVAAVATATSTSATVASGTTPATNVGGTPQATVTAQAQATATVQATLSPPATPQPIPTVAQFTPTPPPPPASEQATLSVQPQTDFSFDVCLNRSLTFYVVNTGDADMTFTLINNTPFKVNPLSGKLGGQNKQGISVSNMSGISSGQILVMASGTFNQPITVSIHCTV